MMWGLRFLYLLLLRPRQLDPVRAQGPPDLLAKALELAVVGGHP